MNSSANDDLLWTAVQYASGDLPDAAADEFERLLETDQAAREALASAVQLCETVACAEGLATAARADSDLSTRRSAVEPIHAGFAWRGPAVGILVAVAAAVAVWFSVDSPRSSDDERAVAAANAENDEARLLAGVWIAGQTLDDGSASILTLHDVTHRDSEFDRSDPTSWDDEIEAAWGVSNDGATAPDWLIAALVDVDGGSMSQEN